MIACQADNAIARQEVFEPVLSVLSFDDDDEAVSIANSTDYGLVAGVVFLLGQAFLTRHDLFELGKEHFR